MSVIYLDNNATTSVAPEVFESMIPFFTEKYGNASSMHTFGGQVGKSIQDAREKVAAMLGAQPEEIVFTSCGTESDSTAVMSALQAQPEKKHVITTRVEHSALIALGQHLEQKGYELTYLGVDSKGRLDLDELSEAMRKDTAIVSIMFANNETGTVFPIQKIAGGLFGAFRAQAPRSQGDRRAVCPQGNAVHPVPSRRASGAGASRRYGKRAVHRRPRNRM